MSNSYNSKLQLNNVDLQSIFDTIRAFPEYNNIEQAAPTISVLSDGRIIATAGDKVATHQMRSVPAETITPTTTRQYAAFTGNYTVGDIIVKGDKNLVASNIKNGVSIFGVVGNYVVNDVYDTGLITRTLSNCTNNNVTRIRGGAFRYCTNLTTVSFPVANTIGAGAFYYCTNLTTVSFPAANTIGTEAFRHCENLTTASFPAATLIDQWAFSMCYNLKSLHLTGSSVCTLRNSNAFAYTPVGGFSVAAGTYGSIYVPASLLTSYQTATNWTYFSSRFVGV